MVLLSGAVFAGLAGHPGVAGVLLLIAVSFILRLFLALLSGGGGVSTVACQVREALRVLPPAILRTILQCPAGPCSPCGRSGRPPLLHAFRGILCPRVLRVCGGPGPLMELGGLSVLCFVSFLPAVPVSAALHAAVRARRDPGFVFPALVGSFPSRLRMRNTSASSFPRGTHPGPPLRTAWSFPCGRPYF